jgi:hypothetical protein
MVDTFGFLPFLSKKGFLLEYSLIKGGSSYTSNKIAATCNKIWFQLMLIENVYTNHKATCVVISS